jgi:tetratricopeptide (TPR) repeat protein
MGAKYSVLLAVLFVSTVAAQRPTTTPQVTLESALAQLQANQYDDALAAFAEFDAGRGSSTVISDDDRFLAVHCMLYIRMLRGEFNEAFPLSARCLAYNTTDRTLLYNIAALELRRRSDPTRTLALLQKHLSLNPTDEQILNLFGCILFQGSMNGSLPARAYQRFASMYEKCNRELEVTRPDMRRWGVDWIETAQYSREISNRRQAESQIQQMEREADSLLDGIKRTRRQLADLRTDSRRASQPRHRRHIERYIRDTMDQLRDQEDDLAAARQAIEQAIRNLPVGRWPEFWDPLCPSETDQQLPPRADDWLLTTRPSPVSSP